MIYNPAYGLKVKMYIFKVRFSKRRIVKTAEMTYLVNDNQLKNTEN